TVLSVIGIILLYLNRKLDQRAKARLEAKAVQRLAARLALIETATLPVLPPLPTYDEVIQLESDDDCRYRRPCELDVTQLDRIRLEQNFSTNLILDPKEDLE